MSLRRAHPPLLAKPLRAAGPLAMTAALLTGCGLTSAPGRPSVGAALQRPSPWPSPTPSSLLQPAPTLSPSPLSSCTEGAAPASPTATGPVFAVTPSPTEVELVSGAGAVLNQAAVSFAPSDPSAVGLGPSGVFLFTPSSGTLSILGRSGPPRALAQITPAGGADSFTLAESPNGRCWIFSDISFSAGGDAVTKLYVGLIDGGAPTLLTTLTRTNLAGGTFAGGYPVLRWDAAGVLLGTEPTGVGGAGPFISEGYSLARVVRLDPLTGTLSAPLCASGRFGDVAADGTVACITGEGSDARIVITAAHGVTTTLDTQAAFAGQVGFVGGSSLLTYCTGTVAPQSSSAGWATDLLSVDLTQQSLAPRMLSSGDGPGLNEAAEAWDKLVGSHSIAELRGTASTSLAVIDLTSGVATTLAPATGLLGVL